MNLALHPVMAAREKEVKNALERPKEIRRSRTDLSIFPFYKMQRMGRWVCAVSKQINGEGFLVTAYPTNIIKVGEKVCPK